MFGIKKDGGAGVKLLLGKSLLNRLWWEDSQLKISYRESAPSGGGGGGPGVTVVESVPSIEPGIGSDVL